MLPFIEDDDYNQHVDDNGDDDSDDDEKDHNEEAEEFYDDCEDNSNQQSPKQKYIFPVNFEILRQDLLKVAKHIIINFPSQTSMRAQGKYKTI